MKIKMKTTSAGPDVTRNWTEGDIRDVCPDEARYWNQAGVCTLLEPYPADAEKAVIVPAQKAVVKPPETASKAVVREEVVKPPVEAPASSGNTVASNKAKTWGTPKAGG